MNPTNQQSVPTDPYLDLLLEICDSISQLRNDVVEIKQRVAAVEEHLGNNPQQPLLQQQQQSLSTVAMLLAVYCTEEQSNTNDSAGSSVGARSAMSHMGLSSQRGVSPTPTLRTQGPLPPPISPSAPSLSPSSSTIQQLRFLMPITHKLEQPPLTTSPSTYSTPAPATAPAPARRLRKRVAFQSFLISTRERPPP
ncbi:hypothetical protein BDC45DRAFT_607843 [Circinella umbellata]|nr:hypothetical protein BDC45DRAFT_607843 [Circinella umbellata]